MDIDSKITFEIPTNLDLDSLIRTNNYTLLFSNLHSTDGGVGLMGSSGGGSSSNSNSAINGNRFVKDLFSNRSRSMSDIEYERFMNEVWITLVLVLFILSIVFCLCSCLLYHKFRQWKRSVALARAAALASHVSSISHYESDHDSLPSYTLVSGLPSYDDALEQMKTKIVRNNTQLKRPSLTKLFNFEHDKSSLEITNYLAPKYEEAATSAPSYEVSIILPQKTVIEKIQKPSFTNMQPFTDIPPTSHTYNHHNHHQSSSIPSEADSFIVNLPPETCDTRCKHQQQQHSKAMHQTSERETLTPELSETRKTEPTLKVKASSVGNLCDIHR